MAKKKDANVTVADAYDYNTQVSPAQLSELLIKAIPKRLSVLVQGATGVGKSAIVGQTGAALDMDVIVSHPVLDDPTDVKGMPRVHDKAEYARWLPFEETYQILSAETPTLWFIDDIGQATPAMQASYMKVLLNRELAGRKLPECVSVVGATNRRTDKAGVSGILEPVKSRFVTIVELVTSIDDFSLHAIKKGFRPEIVGFLKNRPDMLCNFRPTTDMSNSPLPRTWEHVSEILELGLSGLVEFKAICGAVGAEAGAAFIAAFRQQTVMPDLDLLLKNPDKAPIPKQAGALYAVAAGIASKVLSAAAIGDARKDLFPPALVYAARLVDANKGDYAIYMLRTILKVNPGLAAHSAFVRVQDQKLLDLLAYN